MVDAAGCFIAGTMVHTPKGPVAIEALKVGDLVLGCAMAAPSGARRSMPQEAMESKVTAARSVDAQPVLKLKAGALQVTGTAEHPFWRADNSDWAAMGDLEPGDLLLLADGTTVEVESLKALKKPAQVFNLTVDRPHNFRVGEAGALVHNK